MKSFFALLLFVCSLSFAAQADQLAYLSKEDAESAANFIRTQKTLYLYCGCCDANEIPKVIEPVSVEAYYTNYENFYQVVVTYKDENGELKLEHLDLAYVWVEQKQKKKKKPKMVTVGTIMNFEHDPCHDFPKR